MGIVTNKLRQMTMDKLRGINRLEKELNAERDALDAKAKVRRCKEPFRRPWALQTICSWNLTLQGGLRFEVL